MTDLAVILAAGEGRRMRQADHRVDLTAEQGRWVRAARKALTPIPRSFLGYFPTVPGGAGVGSVCLVVESRARRPVAMGVCP
jgi:CTP:molybdopterin cytidylyltransferase MocA